MGHLVADREAARLAVPLEQHPVRGLISLIALSDLEEDGLMLALALAAGLIVFAVDVKLLHEVVQEITRRMAMDGSSS